jgi:hypothetical protein
VPDRANAIDRTGKSFAVMSAVGLFMKNEKWLSLRNQARKIAKIRVVRVGILRGMVPPIHGRLPIGGSRDGTITILPKDLHGVGSETGGTGTMTQATRLLARDYLRLLGLISCWNT